MVGCFVATYYMDGDSGDGVDGLFEHITVDYW